MLDHTTPRPAGTRAQTNPSPPLKAIAYLAAAWCLGFAAVSVWELVTGPEEGGRLAAYASGLAIVNLLVLALKVTGAVVALASVTPRRLGIPVPILAAALWGIFGLLGMYSAGSLVIWLGTVSGLLAPSAAWIAAGGVTLRAVLYVAFFLAGATVFGVLTISFHRRRHVRWPAVAAGLVGAPLLLAGLLTLAPAILGRLGLLPT